MEKLIAVVDDEEDIVELVSVNLKKAGFLTKEFHNGKTFLNSLSKALPDLVVLDLMMPEVDGIEVCKQMKKDERFSGVPIIMLTAKTEESDKVGVSVAVCVGVSVKV